MTRALRSADALARVARAVRIVTATRPRRSPALLTRLAPQDIPSCPFQPACPCGHGRRRDDRTYCQVPEADRERYAPWLLSPHLFHGSEVHG